MELGVQAPAFLLGLQRISRTIENWTSVSQAKCYMFYFKRHLNPPFHFHCPPDLLSSFGVAGIAKYFDDEGFEDVC